MKCGVFLLLFVIAVSFSNFSFAQTQTSLEAELYVNVQSELRDSDGRLIAFMESSKFTFINQFQLDDFLDFEASVGNDPIVTIDGKKYQIIQRAQTVTFDSENVLGSTKLYDNLDGNEILLARFAHDGYKVIPGDSLTSTWTFVRLV